MRLFAVTTLEKIQAVPLQVWLNIGLGVLIVIAGFLVLRAIAQMNKIILCILVAVGVSVVGFNWIYTRNEPKFLTPVIDKIAPFFPSGVAPAPKDKTFDRPPGR